MKLENQIVSQLINWKTYDEQATARWAFYDVELNVPVGDLPAGSKFDFCDYDLFDSKISFSNLNEDWSNRREFNLKLIASTNP